MLTGVSLKFSDREKFCDIYMISGRSFGPNFGFNYTAKSRSGLNFLPRLCYGFTTEWD